VLENREPYRTCLGHAMVRDEQGREMHKSWGNMIEFNDAAEKMGADVVRWLYAVQSPAQNVNFGYGPGDEVRRRFILPLWNVYAFFVTYATLDGWTPGLAQRVTSRPEGIAQPSGPTATDRTWAARRESTTEDGSAYEGSLLDRWLLSCLRGLVETVRERLDDYDVSGAARPIERFVEDLSVWYVRRGRRRYWKSEADADKQAAYSTLYEALVTLARVLAPFVPFLAEALYQNLVRSVDAEVPESVHLCDYPTPAWAPDPRLEEAMDRTRSLISLGRAARNAAKLRVRQPLAMATIVERSGMLGGTRYRELVDHIKEELNVKGVRFAEAVTTFGRLEVRPRFDLLGPKFGGEITKIVEALRAEGHALLARTPEGEPYRLRLADDREVVLERAEVDVRMHWNTGLTGAGEAGDWIVLDTALTDALVREGLARELVHQIQQWRKEAGFEIADRITLYYPEDAVLVDVLTAHGDYVLRETLARDARAGAAPDGPGVHRKTLRLGGRELALAIARAEP